MRVKDHAISIETRENGDWVHQIPDFPGLKLKTRGAGNKDWRKLRDKLINDLPRHKRIDGLSGEDQDRINATLLLEAALIDWEGPEDDAGNALPYSKDQAKQYLFDPSLEAFRNACLWAASVVAERWTNGLDTDSKN